MKILIIEDEPTIRTMFGEIVRRWGYDAVLCEDFEQVLQVFVREKPHLVFMDINLPVYDGFYWCRRIRELSNVPILFLSSRNTPMDMVMAMNVGGDDFIQKPFYDEVLIAKIQALLRRTYAYVDTATDIIEHDGVILNMHNGQIVCGEQSAELTNNEFKIMKMLHKGSIVSRDKIMRALWEDESFVDDNTLTVNMTRIRKKLDEIGKRGLITTVKGEGYMIK